MKTLYLEVENFFDKFATFASRLFTNSIIFLAAFLLVVYWLTSKSFWLQSELDMIRDIVLSITFLSFFIIQKSFSRFSKVLHLKLNELVASHDQANNMLINAEEKTEEELRELAVSHRELVQKEMQLNDQDNQ
jgi:low affinity Fe/Cu permease